MLARPETHGHLLASGGTRTWHRLACAVEDAGFEIRDLDRVAVWSASLSLDVQGHHRQGRGAEREVVGRALTGTAASSSAHVGNLAGDLA